jgi:hypothetical protein
MNPITQSNRRLPIGTSLLALVVLYWAWLGWCVAVGDDVDRSPDSPGSSDLPALMALLVGINDYSNLAESAQLMGSQNDVQLIEQTLRERFRFRADQITTLVNEQATGDAIRLAFSELLSRLESLPQHQPAYVVFHFSGHGSQLADQPSGFYRDEPDGLDETILPSDAVARGGEVEIRDDELNDFAHRVCARPETHLWMILDCCHSGTGVRGSNATRFRALPRHLLAASTSPDEQQILRERQLPINAIALYACQSIEKEPEFTDGQQTYGLLTKSLTDVLTQTKQVSTLTYARLAELIESRYRADRRIVPAPKPGVEGAKDNIVCGAGAELNHADWIAIPDPSDAKRAWIQAGKLDGITVGSLFALHPTGTNETSSPGEPIRWLGVDKVEAASTRTQIYRHTGVALEDATWPEGVASATVSEQYHEPDDIVTRVRVVHVHGGSTETIITQQSASPHTAMLHSIFTTETRNQSSSSLSWVGSDDNYDLVLKIEGQQAALFPAIAMAYSAPRRANPEASLPASLRGGWGPFQLTDTRQTTIAIRGAIDRITRARMLIQLCDEQPTDSPIGLRLELQRLDVRDGTIVSRQPWRNEHAAQDPTDHPVVIDGDCYDWTIHYESKDHRPAYLTVLQINSDMGIQMMIPAAIGAASPRINDADQIQVGGYQCCRDEDDQFRVGPRWTIAIATYAANQYSWLGQDSLSRIRGAGLFGLGNPSKPASTLDRLLLRNMGFRNRGDASGTNITAYDPSWAVAIKTWMAIEKQESQP